MEKTANQDEIREKELLVVSFGTSDEDSCRLSIGAIEDRLGSMFPEFTVKRAFSSQTVIDRIRNRDNVTIDSVEEALKYARDHGIKALMIQPTYLLDGPEYNRLLQEADRNTEAFEHVTVGKPLLSEDADLDAVIQAVTDVAAEYDDGKTAICLFGHGTETGSNEVYFRMQKKLSAAGYGDYYVGMLKAAPYAKDVLAKVQQKDYTRVVLEPLMIVAGRHVKHDMAGENGESWKTVFENAGYEVIPVVRGLGELAGVQNLIARHVLDAVDQGDMQSIFKR